MGQLPSKILKEPLIDATVEIRFEPAIDKGQVFDSLYYVLSDLYPEVEELSIRKIPEEVRHNDPRFFEKPEFRIFNEKFNVQIGPNTLSVHCNDPSYPGWEEYSSEIIKVIERVENQSIIKSVNRVGIRYINFLPYTVNIFRDLKLVISHSGRATTELPASVRFTFEERDYFFTTLQIANYVEAVKGEEVMFGSIIDVDTYRTEFLEDFFEESITVLEEAHSLEKEMFFGLFTDEYLESLNPKYDDDEPTEL